MTFRVLAVCGCWNTEAMPNNPDAALLAAEQSTTRLQALEVLKELVGNADARFHDGQYEAIEALVDAGRRALVVQRTGWGKSAVYFVSSLLLRRRAQGQPS
ncbi:atp-Dependent DNA helicase [Arthrobacter sp. Hiyo8]|nr:atp-Dependent DNA helicase [Arthrobacter sp. Hiyo8]